MSRKTLAILIFVLALVGAGMYWWYRPTATEPSNAKNQTVTLSAGKSSTILDGLRITLVRINDSRCMADVVCIWAGELAAELTLTDGSFGSQTSEVILGQTTRPSVTAGIYTLTLENISETSATITVAR